VVTFVSALCATTRGDVSDAMVTANRLTRFDPMIAGDVEDDSLKAIHCGQDVIRLDRCEPT
jgi:hypothetical protein